MHAPVAIGVVEPGKNTQDGFSLRVKDVVFSDHIDIASSFEDLSGLLLEAA
jgi:hypothetical protein